MVNYASNEFKNNNGSLRESYKIYNNYDNQLEYEGDLAKCNYSGYGTLYDANGNIKYRGEFVKGKFDGYGELYYESGNLKYIGQFSRGKFNGEGKLFYDDENQEFEYIGEFANGEFNGKGELFSRNISYIYDERLWYKGEFLNGRICGKGEFLAYNDSIYKGNFLDDHMVGPGEEIKSNRKFVTKGCFDTGSIKEILYQAINSRPIIPKLNGYATTYTGMGYNTSYYVDGIAIGKTYSYDKAGTLLSIVDVDNKQPHRNGIEFRATKHGRECREFKIEKGSRVYTPIDNDRELSLIERLPLYMDFDGRITSCNKKVPIYWQVEELLNDKKTIELDKNQSYELMIDVLDNKAHTEVDIICPWINDWAIDINGDFFNALKKALKRGVTVKIITGIGDVEKDSRCEKTWKNAIELEQLLDDCKENLHFEKGNTHVKRLLCDNDLEMFGSQNLTSGHPDNTDWEEEMKCHKNADEIHECRNKRFNFLGRDVLMEMKKEIEEKKKKKKKKKNEE